MVGVVFSLVLSVIVAGVAWLLLGARFKLANVPESNNMLNFLCYLLIAMPFAIAMAFFGLQ